MEDDCAALAAASSSAVKKAVGTASGGFGVNPVLTGWQYEAKEPTNDHKGGGFSQAGL